jgi:hypothetical protein
MIVILSASTTSHSAATGLAHRGDLRTELVERAFLGQSRGCLSLFVR